MATNKEVVEQLSKLLVDFFGNVNARLESIEKRVDRLEQGSPSVNEIHRVENIRDHMGDVVRAAAQSREQLLRVAGRPSQESTEPTARAAKQQCYNAHTARPRCADGNTSDARSAKRCTKLPAAPPLLPLPLPTYPLRRHQVRLICPREASHCMEHRAAVDEGWVCNHLLFVPEDYVPTVPGNNTGEPQPPPDDDSQDGHTRRT